jgi:sirohydrochlorin ferrochelatase
MSPSRCERHREPNLRKLLKASTNNGRHHFALLHLFAAMARHVDRSSTRATKGEEAALEKEASCPPLHLFVSPLAATVDRG